MRHQAFGVEPEGTLLESDAVAQTVLDLLCSDLTGQVLDVRLAKHDPARADSRLPEGITTFDEPEVVSPLEVSRLSGERS